MFHPPNKPAIRFGAGSFHAHLHLPLLPSIIEIRRVMSPWGPLGTHTPSGRFDLSRTQAQHDEGTYVYCTDTGGLQAVHCPHLDAKTASRLDKLIGLLKRGFRGNAKILLMLSGGHIDDMKVNEASFDEAKVNTID